MKHNLKIVLFGALLGASSLALAQTAAPDVAALAACHQDLAKDLTKFKTDVASAKKEHSVSPMALKRLQMREANITNHEARLKHETLANCQAERKALEANDALLLRDVAFGQCHKAVRADILKFRADLGTARKEHALTAPAMHRISLREKAILDHEANLAKHETLANCKAEDKALKATDALLLRDIAFGKCHYGATLAHAKISKDIQAGLANKSLTPVKMFEVKKAEAEIKKHESALNKKETLAQCEEFKGQLVALEKTVAPHLK